MSFTLSEPSLITFSSVDRYRRSPMHRSNEGQRYEFGNYQFEQRDNASRSVGKGTSTPDGRLSNGPSIEDSQSRDQYA